MPRFIFRHASLPVALLLLALTQTANAQDTYFPNDATINYTVTGNAIVGYPDASGQPPTSPTIDLVSGGIIYGGALETYNHSTVNFSGGNTSAYIVSFGNSTINVDGGNYGVDSYNNSIVNIFDGTGSIYTHNSSTANIGGGNVVGVLRASDNSTVTINGGIIGTTAVGNGFFDLIASDNSTVNLNGGNISNILFAEKNSTINMSGSIPNKLVAYNGCTVNVSGGIIAGHIDAHGGNRIAISGGSIGFLSLVSSTLTMSGGSINDELVTNGYCTINVSGGSIGTGLFADGGGTVTISGGNFGNDNFGGLYAGNGTLNLIGGNVGYEIDVAGNITVNVSGGSIGSVLYVRSSGTLNLLGTGLRATLIDPQASFGYYSQYTLFGAFSDGTSIKGKILYLENNSNAHFTLKNVPKPRNVNPIIGRANREQFARQRTRRV